MRRMGNRLPVNGNPLEILDFDILPPDDDVKLIVEKETTTSHRLLQFFEFRFVVFLIDVKFNSKVDALDNVDQNLKLQQLLLIISDNLQ